MYIVLMGFHSNSSIKTCNLLDHVFPFVYTNSLSSSVSSLRQAFSCNTHDHISHISPQTCYRVTLKVETCIKKNEEEHYIGYGKQTICGWVCGLVVPDEGYKFRDQGSIISERPKIK